jgi:mRNA interferase MazF
MKQFSIVLVNLNPTKGSEQQGIRPCVVLQTNAVHKVAKTFLVAPLSSKQLEKIYPYQVLINPSKANGLSIPSKLKLEQIRVVDIKRVQKTLGQLEAQYVEQVLQAMDLIFDREQDFA